MTYFSNQFSGQYCPQDHPFAYKNGKYCCRTNQELENGGSQSEITSGTCDGEGFSRESSCCKDHRNIKCPLPNACYDNDQGRISYYLHDFFKICSNSNILIGFQKFTLDSFT